MATHSSVLARRVPGPEEPTGLPTMGSHRVVRNRNDLRSSNSVTMDHSFQCCRTQFIYPFSVNMKTAIRNTFYISPVLFAQTPQYHLRSGDAGSQNT